MRAVLTIAGSDSGGGAGIQADLKTFAAHGLYGASVLTAVTAQNTQGVALVAPLAADLVAAQIETVAGDIRFDATKIGMLGTAAIVEAVAAAVDGVGLPLVVLDPVIVSSSGERLLDPDGVETLRRELIPRVRVLTPNVREAEVLSGVSIGPGGDRRAAAERLHALGVSAVVVTGGDAADRGGAPADPVVDLLFDGREFVELAIPRVITAVAVHGTGCTFAAALAAGLARGEPVRTAAERAQRYVAGAIAHARQIGRGARVLDHFWEHGAPDRR